MGILEDISIHTQETDSIHVQGAIVLMLHTNKYVQESTVMPHIRIYTQGTIVQGAIVLPHINTPVQEAIVTRHISVPTRDRATVYMEYIQIRT